jgi:RimJ/RimL family protein N-acetyltransferase
MDGPRLQVDLVTISPAAAAAILDGSPPPGLTVPDDYPTEFSAGVAQGATAKSEGALGPFFICRPADGIVVGEIGGAFVEEATIEIGYAVVDSQQGQGHATGAVVAIVDIARKLGSASRIIAHTPLDRPASGRVVEKAGFERRGVVEDEHEGEVLSVYEWELRLS